MASKSSLIASSSLGSWQVCKLSKSLRRSALGRVLRGSIRFVTAGLHLASVFGSRLFFDSLKPRWFCSQTRATGSLDRQFLFATLTQRLLILLFRSKLEITSTSQDFAVCPPSFGEGSHGSVSRVGLEYNNLFKEFKSVNINHEMGTMLLKCFWGNDLGHFFDRFPQKLVLHTY